MKNSVLIFAALLSIVFGSNAQSIDAAFFQQVDKVLKSHVKDGLVNYKSIAEDAGFQNLISIISRAEFENLTPKSKQAFLINSYNLLVIKEVVDNNINESVNSKSDFFDANSIMVGGQKISLNTLEKKYLLKPFADPRFHFVLVCGAKSCPPITNFAYTPELLDRQLDAQTRLAINNPEFIQINRTEKKAGLSKIFSWYAADFGGGKKAAVKFINTFLDQPIPEDFSIDYYQYDWALNAQSSSIEAASNSQSNNDNRYVVSSAIPKGTTETKIFNNLYTQRTRNSVNEAFNARSNFFTTSLSFLYGISNRFNLGFDLRYRRVSNTGPDKSPLNVFTNNAESRRQGITNIGPKIRWAPIPALSNFSIQSAFWIPVGKNLQGTESQPYIDWDGASWNTQLFNDYSIGSRFSLFTELDFFIEDIGKKGEGDLNRFSTPATVILSYFPNPQTTIYALSNFSPFWQKDFDYFAQAGIGAKYQVTSKFEIELLYTGFTNNFLSSINGRASTFNIGVRISG